MTNKEIKDSVEQDDIDVIQINTQDNLEISLNALKGQHIPRTLKLTSYKQNRLIQILIIGGLTHNFIQPKVREYAKLLVQLGKVFKVMVDNGQHLECSGLVTNMGVEL